MTEGVDPSVASDPAQAASPAAESAPVKKKPNEAFELVKTIVYALLIALVLRVLLFQPFTIPSASMEPTLLEGDYIIVSKYAYGWSRHSIPFSPPILSGRIAERQPQRGDVVVFKLPRDGRTDYIKRLVGLPGDKIQVIQGQLNVNGKPVPRTEISPEVVESAFGAPRQVQRYTNTLGKHQFTTYSLDPGSEVENTAVYTVPAGNYFMMGDNRDNSVDSRYPTEVGVGFVPAENLVGRAELILLSWREGASLFKPWTWFLDARIDRFARRIE
jgi:signal peptidase I